MLAPAHRGRRAEVRFEERSPQLRRLARRVRGGVPWRKDYQVVATVIVTAAPRASLPRQLEFHWDVAYR